MAQRTQVLACQLGSLGREVQLSPPPCSSGGHALAAFGQHVIATHYKALSDHASLFVCRLRRALREQGAKVARGAFLGNSATTAVCEPPAAAKWLSMGAP